MMRASILIFETGMSVNTVKPGRREWTLRKARAEAICDVFSKGSVLEVRLFKSGDAILRTQVRSESEVRTTQRAWREALEASGWTGQTGAS
jgi:hypothetical protein